MTAEKVVTISRATISQMLQEPGKFASVLPVLEPWRAKQTQTKAGGCGGCSRKRADTMLAANSDKILQDIANHLQSNKEAQTKLKELLNADTIRVKYQRSPQPGFIVFKC